jgi:hypothetical protein
MNLEASGLGDGPQKCDHRPFAVGAGDMDCWWQAMMRVPQLFKQGKATIKTKINQFWVEPRQPVKRGTRAARSDSLRR